MSRSVPLCPSGPAKVVLALIAAVLLTAVVAVDGPVWAAAQQQQQDERPRDPDERAAGIRDVNEDEAPAGGATLLLTPARLRPAVGAAVRLTLSILGADDVRRLPATLHYDPAVLELVAVQPGSAWQGGPDPVLLYDDSRPGEVVIGLGLLDKDQPGISGSAELIEVEFRAIGRGDAALRLDRYGVIGAGSKPQLATALAAEIVVQ